MGQSSKRLDNSVREEQVVTATEVGYGPIRLRFDSDTGFELQLVQHNQWVTVFAGELFGEQVVDVFPAGIKRAFDAGDFETL